MNTQTAIDITRYPSVMATMASPRTSERYAFVPTTRVVDILAKAGWYPSKVMETNSRLEEKLGFQRHLIRFRREQDFGVAAVVGALVPEIVLTNAHDLSAVFELNAALYRFICGNGAVVADSTFATHKIKHIGFQDQNVLDAVYEVVDTTPKILDRVNEFQKIELTRDEQLAFAASSLMAKYEDEEQIKKFDVTKIIQPVRSDDMNDKVNGTNTL